MLAGENDGATVKRFLWFGAMCIAAAAAAIGPQAARAADPCLRVNEVYAVGGTATSTYNRDFVELRNVCGTAQTFTGALVIFPTAGGGANVSLTNIMIPANGYYLIGFGTAGGPGTGASFTADRDDGNDLLSANAFVGLTNTGVQFDPCDPVDNGIWFDLVGYGTSPPCSETTPAVAPSATQSIARTSGIDTDVNSVDFTLQAPTPQSANSLAVTFAGMTASRTARGVLLRWRTASEFETLGFHVYRQRGQRRVRVNRRLIASLGSVSGGSYSFLDRRAPRRSAVCYWLQEVELDGSRTWHGPVRVRQT